MQNIRVWSRQRIWPGVKWLDCSGRKATVFVKGLGCRSPTVGESAGKWEGGMTRPPRVNTALVDDADGVYAFEKKAARAKEKAAS